MKAKDAREAETKVEEYRMFVETVLRPQLRLAKESHLKTQQEKDEYSELLLKIKEIAKGNRSQEEQVDLGHAKVFCQAQRNEDPVVYIHVGMGFHVEFTPKEGIEVVQKRLDFLDRVLSVKNAKLKQVGEHVVSAELILDHLAQEIRRR